MAALTPIDTELCNPRLEPVKESPWIGKVATGLYRAKGTVERVYETPYGQVALLSRGHAPSKSLQLQMTELLSAPGLPATRRLEYLRNGQRLRALRFDEAASKQTKAAWHRRVNLFVHHRQALRFVEASLLEQVKAGDELVYRNGPRAVVLDAEAKRCSFMGWRTHMRVQSSPDSHSQDVFRLWGWEEGARIEFLEHDGAGLQLPTLGLI